MPEYVYTPRFISTGDKVESITALGGTIYYATDNFEFFSLSPDGEPEKLPIPLPTQDESGDTEAGASDEYIIDCLMFQPDREGNYYVAYAGAVLEKEEGAKGDYTEFSYMIKYDHNGNELCRENSSLLSTISLCSVDKENRPVFYSYGNDQLYVFNTDCTLNQSAEGYKSGSFFTDSGGGIYLVDEMNCSVQMLDPKTSRLSSAYQNIPSGFLFSGYMDTGFLSEDGGTICYSDKASGSSEVLIRLMNCGVYDDDLEWMGALDGGQIVLYNDAAEPEIIILTKTPRSEIPDKKTITVGTFQSSRNLRRVAANFNRANDEYRVEVKAYYESSLDSKIAFAGMDEAKTAFHLDIASGKFPDVITLDYDDMCDYASAGLFEDLTPYYNSSSVEVPESILEAYTIDGSLDALPGALRLRTLVGKSADLDGAESWTLEEMIAFTEKNEGKKVFHMDSGGMLESCLCFNLSRFVDWENYTCDFENETFYKLLAYCKDYYNKEGKSYISTAGLTSFDDSYIVDEMCIDDPKFINALYQVYNTQGISFIGYPGGGSVLEATWDGSYSICAKSQDKDGAWQFIEALMTSTSTDAAFIVDGFPADNASRELFLQKSMIVPEGAGGSFGRPHTHTFTSPGGFSIKFYIPNQAEIDLLKDLIDSAQVSGNDAAILSIIEECSEMYFAGDAAVESAAEQIQGRVELYLNEKK